MENKKKVILDCDPGHDDAFGIMLAVQHLDVLGITTIGGNCTLENVTRNAIKVLEVLGVADRIGVYPGHSCPMVAPLVTGAWVLHNRSLHRRKGERQAVTVAAPPAHSRIRATVTCASVRSAANAANSRKDLSCLANPFPRARCRLM